MVSNIAILGAGTMGQGIAQVAALGGFNVMIYDLNVKILKTALEGIESNLQKGEQLGKITKDEKIKAGKNISITSDISSLKADLFIEAIIENIEVKHELFQRIQRDNPDAILATNTSSIPITQIAAELPNPEYVVGMHFFNPAHIMKLVEIIRGVRTKKEIVGQIMKVADKMGKVPVLANDSPGFIVNRVARHYYVESLKLLEEEISTVEGIDQLLEATGFRMGPFRLMDLIGVDTNLSVTQTMYKQFHEEVKFRPSRIQKQLVESGKLGKKSGEGFYTYDSE